MFWRTSWFLVLRICIFHLAAAAGPSQYRQKHQTWFDAIDLPDLNPYWESMGYHQEEMRGTRSKNKEELTASSKEVPGNSKARPQAECLDTTAHRGIVALIQAKASQPSRRLTYRLESTILWLNWCDLNSCLFLQKLRSKCWFWKSYLCGFYELEGPILTK